MPQLADQNIAVEAEDGTEFEYKAVTHVTKDGHEFTVSLDERLVESARKLEREARHVTVHLTHQKWRVCAAKLVEAVEFIKACAKDYLACETVTERVIVYGYHLNVSYYKDEAGHIRPNGVGCTGGGWAKTEVNANHPVSFYSVGLAAAVFDKTSYKRSSGTTHQWDLVRLDDRTQPAALLNAWCGLSIEPEDLGNNCQRLYKEMPYTDEAAMFFHGLLLNLSTLAETVGAFFGDAKRLQAAIASGQRLLSLPR